MACFRIVHMAECCLPCGKRLGPIQERRGDSCGLRPRQPDDTEPPAAGWSGNGDDRVVCGEHNRTQPAVELAALSRNQNGLEKRVTDALGRHGVVLGNCEVNDAARVRIEGTDFLRRS